MVKTKMPKRPHKVNKIFWEMWEHTGKEQIAIVDLMMEYHMEVMSMIAVFDVTTPNHRRFWIKHFKETIIPDLETCVVDTSAKWAISNPIVAEVNKLAGINLENAKLWLKKLEKGEFTGLENKEAVFERQIQYYSVQAGRIEKAFERGTHKKAWDAVRVKLLNHLGKFDRRMHALRAAI